MPTYEYKCTECNYTFDIFQTMSAEVLKECPKCKGILKRLIGTGAGTIFKGSGFYQTDYKNKSTSGGKNNGGTSKSKPVKKDSGNANKKE